MKEENQKISAEYEKALNTKANSLVKSTGKARYADYSQKDLLQLPEGITENSFGCGNPTSFSNIKAGQSVLDLGCGAGLDLLLAADKVGESGQVIGVDMTDDMLEMAKKNIEKSTHRNIELKKGIIEDLPIETSSVDWVISNCVINLSPEKDKVFSEISRVLKPGGEVLFSDIVAENIPWWVRKSGVLTAACAGGAIPEKDYLQKLQEAGLTECDVVARQYYEPIQMATTVLDAFPKLANTLSCCGKSLLTPLLIWIAKPIAKNLWSAKFSAKLALS